MICVCVLKRCSHSAVLALFWNETMMIIVIDIIGPLRHGRFLQDDLCANGRSGSGERPIGGLWEKMVFFTSIILVLPLERSGERSHNQ